MEGPRLLVSFLTLCVGPLLLLPTPLLADDYSFGAEELGMKQGTGRHTLVEVPSSGPLGGPSWNRNCPLLLGAL